MEKVDAVAKDVKSSMIQILIQVNASNRDAASIVDKILATPGRYRY
jgi:hypothetical protein